MRINLQISKIWSSYNCGLPLCFGTCTIAGVYDYFNFEYFHGSYCILCKTFSMDLEVSGLSFPVFDFWLDISLKPEEYRREIIILCLRFVMDCRILCISFRLKIVGRFSSFRIPYAKSRRIGFRAISFL